MTIRQQAGEFASEPNPGSVLGPPATVPGNLAEAGGRAIDGSGRCRTASGGGDEASGSSACGQRSPGDTVASHPRIQRCPAGGLKVRLAWVLAG